MNHLRLIFPGFVLVLLVGLSWPGQGDLPPEFADLDGRPAGYAYPGQYGDLFVAPQAEVGMGRPDFVTYQVANPFETLVSRYQVAMPALGWTISESDLADSDQAQLVFHKERRLAMVRIDRVDAHTSAVVISVYSPGGA